MNKARSLLGAPRQGLDGHGASVSSPPPFEIMPSLATPDDIVARLGRNLNQVEAARVNAMLQDGSAIIRRYARENFIYVQQDVIRMVSDSGTMVIPSRPVISINSVTALSEFPGIPDLNVTWYGFDGIDTLMVPEPYVSGIINLPEYWYMNVWNRQSFDIDHTHGYTQTPGEVLALLCNAIISELSTPTMSATLQGETIGAYSYTMRRGYGAAGASGGALAGMYAALRDFGMQEILQDYRQGVGTIATRFLCSHTVRS